MSIPIQEILNKALREKNKERGKKEITSWHISKLGSCLRGTYFERIGAKPDEEIDDRTLRIFDIGNKVEDWIVGLLEDRKDIKVETQLRVEDKKLGVSGYADVKIEYEKEIKLYEIKSKNSRSFHWMVKKGQGAMRQHEYQLWTYLYLLGIESGSIFYVSKDDMVIAEFPVFLNNQSIKKEVLNEIKLLNKAWESKDPSILPLYDEKAWQSKYCRFHSHCKKI